MAGKTTVAPRDASQKNSPLAGPIESEATVVLNTADSGCFWNGQSFAEGDQVDAEGVVYECSYGQWVKKSG